MTDYSLPIVFLPCLGAASIEQTFVRVGDLKNRFPTLRYGVSCKLSYPFSPKGNLCVLEEIQCLCDSRTALLLSLGLPNVQSDPRERPLYELPLGLVDSLISIRKKLEYFWLLDFIDIYTKHVPQAKRVYQSDGYYLKGSRYIDLIEKQRAPISDYPMKNTFHGITSSYSRIIEFPAWISCAKEKDIKVFAESFSVDYPSLDELDPLRREDYWKKLCLLQVYGIETENPDQLSELLLKT